MQDNPFGRGSLFVATNSDQTLVLNFLKQAEQSGYIQSVDYHFASFICHQLEQVTDQIVNLETINLMTLLAAYTSNQVLSQHTCIELDKFYPATAFNLALPEQLLLPSRDSWFDCVTQTSVCQTFTAELERLDAPFVLFDNLLYLNRYFQYEWFVAQFIKSSQQVLTTSSWFTGLSEQQISNVCDQYFAATPDGDIDWQKQAVLNAIARKFAVITGGPGTGKTTTVVKLLACLQELKLEQSEHSLHIQLVAPTGKAAQRLSESISASVNKLQLTTELQRVIPTQASTIHRLLKPRGLTEFTYHTDHKLSLDVLILDEASMVDISLMYRLFSALPEHAQVVLLGDKQQLASVEAGNVLSELAQTANNDFMVELQKSYRFDDKSDIGQLAQAIKHGQSAAAINKLKQSAGPLYWYKAEQKQLPRLIEYAVEHYVQLRQTARALDLSLDSNIQRVFSYLAQFQLLTCVRQGEFGVEGLNSQIQNRIAKRTHQAISAVHYEFRPIMINENAYHLELYNGDIGIELVNPVTKQLMAYFIQGTGEVKQVHCQRLPSHETVYAMTVHKSQGSEFAHAALVLPDHGSSLISKEIIYTGLTRAKTQFSLYAGEYNLRQGLQSKSQRYSGLSKMLSSG